MSDVERVAAAMREADAELQVQPPDVAETVGHARRSLVRRLLIVGVLGALGATLLIVGGSAPAFKQLRTAQAKDTQQKTGESDHGGGKGGGGGGKNNGTEDGGQEKGGGGSPKHPERLRAAVGPGKPIEISLPDLVVSRVTKTEVTVENRSEVSSDPFVVSVIVEAEGQNTVTYTVPFEKGLEAEGEETEPFKPPCESGTVRAEVDPENAIEESSEEDNASPESPPLECEPTGDEEEGTTEKGKRKETSGSGSGTGTVDAATDATGGATAP